MKKRLFSLLLVLAMMVGMLPTMALAAEPVQYTQADIINGVWLTWDTIANANTVENEVTSNLVLPTSDETPNPEMYAFGEYTGLAADVTWASSNTNVISTAGVVTCPSEDTEVTLTATIVKSGAFPYLPAIKALPEGKDMPDSGSSTKEFTVTVKAGATGYTDPVDVTVMVQQDGGFLQMPTTLSVSGQLSEDYGLTTGETIFEPTALDALVAVHVEMFGDDFTKDTAGEYLEGDSWITKAFATDTETGFSVAVNDECPNDGIVNSLCGTYTGYTMDQTEIQEDDVLNFFFYDADSSYGDYLTYFDNAEYEVVAGEDLKVNLEGYAFMADGCSPNANILPVAGVKIATVNEVGVLQETSFTTDEKGDATISFDEVGEYIISATGNMDVGTKVPIICPLATVTVTRAPGVTLNKEEAVTSVGEDVTLTAEVYPTGDVTWTSSDAEVATVEGGKVTGVSNGTVTIAATSGAYSDTCTVKVARKIQGSDYSAYANLFISDGKTVVHDMKELYVPKATYTEKSSVDHNGLQIECATVLDVLKKSGVEFTVNDSGMLDTLNGKPAANSAIIVNNTMYDDGILVESVYGDYYTGYTANEQRISDDDVVSIFFYQDSYWMDYYAYFTETYKTVAEGDAFTVSLKGFQPMMSMSGTTGPVPEVMAGVAIYPISTSAMAVTVEAMEVELDTHYAVKKVGDTFTLTADVSPDELSDKSVTWTTSDEKVATVDADGNVTIAGVGSATITVALTADATVTDICEVFIGSAPTFDMINILGNGWETGKTYKANVYEYDLVLLSATASSFSFASTTKYDDTKYSAKYEYTDMYGEDQSVAYPGGKWQSVANLQYGTSDVKLIITDLEDNSNFTTYTFHVTRSYPTSNTFASGKIVVAPNGRAISATPYKNKPEGTLFRVNDGVESTATGVWSTCTTYNAYLLENAKKFDLTLTSPSVIDGVRYSVDDGATWTEINYAQKLTLDVDGTATVKVQIVSGDNMVHHDGFEVAENIKEYTINVTSVNASPSSAQILTANFSAGELYGAKENQFDQSMYSYTIVVPSDFDENLEISYTISEGATAKIGSDLQVADNAGNYTLAFTSETKKITVTSADGDIINNYTFALQKASAYNVPDAVVDYLVPHSQYTNSPNYGMQGEKMLSGTMKSLGNFGGYVTFYYEDGITNDPNNKFGLDFYVMGNAYGTGPTFPEPGQVWVSEDNVTWYALAGSEHYEDDTIWDYQITYTKNALGKADWKDNQGNSATGVYNYPNPANYPLHDFGTNPDTMTLSGIYLPAEAGTTNGAATFFGYVDGLPNTKTDSNSKSAVDTNAYLATPTSAGGFDLAWAVDAEGQPVDISNKEFNYVKVVTASNINAGAIGEKSTEVTYVIRTTAQESAVGVTEAPTGVTISSAVGNTVVNFKDGQNVYDVDLGSAKYLTIGVNGADAEDNIYVNNQRIATDGVATGFVVSKDNDKTVRVIVQNGDKEPAIYILNLSSSASSESDGIEAIYGNVGGVNREAKKGNDGNYTMSVAYTVDTIGISAVTAEDYTINGEATADSYVLDEGENVFTLATVSGQTVALIVTKAKAPAATEKELTVYVTVYGPAGEYDAEKPLVFGKSKSGFEAVLEKTKVTVMDGSTAWNAMQKVLDSAEISYVNADGNYISAVNGMGEFDRGTLSGWMYTVDGKYSAYGVNEYLLNNGDSIVLHYTDDYTQEKASESFGGSTVKPEEEVVAEEETVTMANFMDVKANDWFYDAVEYAVENNLFKGISDTRFAPNANMTRAMIWTVLARASGVDTSTGTTWYQVGQDWAKKTGVSDGTNPDGNVTREQLATMLYRYSKQAKVTADMSKYTDLDQVSNWALEGMNWAVNTGIVTGKTTTTLAPSSNATRAEVATMMMRYLEQ